MRTGGLAIWLAAAAVAMVTVGTAAREPQAAVEAEKVLVERLGFSQEEVVQVRAGQAITRLLPSREPVEVGVVGAVRVSGSPDRLVYWLKEIANFRQAAELGPSGKLGTPPRLEDFGDLALSPEELKEIKDCTPGKCGIRLGDQAIARFRELDWSAPDAASRANHEVRQMLLRLAEAYLRGGDAALGAAHDERQPRVSADEFHALLGQSGNFYDLAPALASFLERFPSAPLAGGEQFVYWAHGGAGPEASTSLHHMVISPSPGGGAVIVDKQLYSSRYTDAALAVFSLSPTADKAGYYVLLGARARARMLGGTTARLLRGRVEKFTLETAADYLTWLQGCMALAR